MNPTDDISSASDGTSWTDLPLLFHIQLAGFLGVMWSSIVCVGASIWLVSGKTAFLEVLVAFGILMTGLTIYRANHAVSWRSVRVTRGRPARHIWRT